MKWFATKSSLYVSTLSYINKVFKCMQVALKHIHIHLHSSHSKYSTTVTSADLYNALHGDIASANLSIFKKSMDKSDEILIFQLIFFLLFLL